MRKVRLVVAEVSGRVKVRLTMRLAARESEIHQPFEPQGTPATRTNIIFLELGEGLINKFHCEMREQINGSKVSAVPETRNICRARDQTDIALCWDCRDIHEML